MCLEYVVSPFIRILSAFCPPLSLQEAKNIDIQYTAIKKKVARNELEVKVLCE